MTVDYSFKNCITIILRLSQNLALTSFLPFSCYFSEHYLHIPIKQNTTITRRDLLSLTQKTFHIISFPWSILCYIYPLYQPPPFKISHFKQLLGSWHNFKGMQFRTLGDTVFKGLGQKFQSKSLREAFPKIFKAKPPQPPLNATTFITQYYNQTYLMSWESEDREKLYQETKQKAVHNLHYLTRKISSLLLLVNSWNLLTFSIYP